MYVVCFCVVPRVYYRVIQMHSMCVLCWRGPVRIDRVRGGVGREVGMWSGDLLFVQAEDGIRDLVRSRGLGDGYKRQGAEWPAYQALMGHNFPPGSQRDWLSGLFGSSEDAAEFYLVIDRESERAWMVPAEEASQVLRLQWPVYEVAPLPSDSMAEWLEMLQRGAARVRPLAMVDIERRMAESQAPVSYTHLRAHRTRLDHV